MIDNSSQFLKEAREAFDDGWHEGVDSVPKHVATTLTAENVRTIITRNNSPDLPFDRTINPYRGCEHGCIYCYARAAHAYLGLSPGLDFETKLFFVNRLGSGPLSSKLAQQLETPIGVGSPRRITLALTFTAVVVDTG